MNKSECFVFEISINRAHIEYEPVEVDQTPGLYKFLEGNYKQSSKITGPDGMNQQEVEEGHRSRDWEAYIAKQEAVKSEREHERKLQERATMTQQESLLASVREMQFSFSSLNERNKKEKVPSRPDEILIEVVDESSGKYYKFSDSHPSEEFNISLMNGKTWDSVKNGEFVTYTTPNSKSLFDRMGVSLKGYFRNMLKRQLQSPGMPDCDVKCDKLSSPSSVSLWKSR